MHENESHVLENDISWDDFLSDLDDICHPELYTCMPVSDECQDISTEEERSASQRRAEAFRRSFWYVNISNKIHIIYYFSNYQD